MNRDETKQVIQYIVNSGATFRTPNLSDTIDVWHDMLKEYAFADVVAATKVTLATSNSGFAPTVGQIISNIHISDKYVEINDSEAWDMVSRALRRSNYYSAEEFEKLPEKVQRAVGGPSQLREWATADLDSLQVISSNFRKTYRAECEKVKEFNRIPQPIQELINGAKCDYSAKLEQKQQETLKLSTSEEKPADEWNTAPEWVREKIEGLRR